MKRFHLNDCIKTTLSITASLIAIFLMFLSVRRIGLTGYLIPFFISPLFFIISFKLNLNLLLNYKKFDKSNFILHYLHIFLITINVAFFMLYAYYLITLLTFILAR